MILANDILQFLDSKAPVCDACEWDNCGLLCGDYNAQITKAIVCLDITCAVVDEAIKNGCKLIISHHPVIFGGVTSITCDSVIYKLIKNDITAICMHTNLDIADNIGVNVCLANALNLQNTKLIKEEFLCIGEISNNISAKEFAHFVKEKLSCKALKYTDSDTIRKIGVSSGAGSDAIMKMKMYNLDALVTSEVKHHQWLYADENKLCVVDAGHFCTENVVISVLTETLQDQFSDVDFLVSETCIDPVYFV